jgi:ADP-ribosylglycohydrolase
MIERYRGSIVGLAAGDALGHPTEFVGSIHGIKDRWGGLVERFQPAGRHAPGTFTDDTQMTIAVARALIRKGHGTLDELMAVLADEFVAWSRSRENDRAPGGTCLRGCANLAKGVPWRTAGVEGSKGCGAAMRAAPVGLYFADDVEQLVRVAAAQSSLTHRHPTGIASSVAAAAPVAHVVRTGSLDGVLEFTRACVDALTEDLLVEMGCTTELARTIGIREMVAFLDRTEAALDREAEDVCSLLGGAWVGEEAVATALWCVLKANGDFKESIVRGANSSGDSDSIATIAGSIAGALVGWDAIDAHYRTEVEKAAMLDALARRLHATKHGSDEGTTAADLDPFGAQRAAGRISGEPIETEDGDGLPEDEELDAYPSESDFDESDFEREPGDSER